MPSDQFDFVRGRATGCRPISPGLDVDPAHRRQLILKLIEVICGNCLNAKRQWFSVFCVSCSKIFLRVGNNPVVLKNSTEHAEPLFTALIASLLLKSMSNDLHLSQSGFPCVREFSIALPSL